MSKTDVLELQSILDIKKLENQINILLIKSIINYEIHFAVINQNGKLIEFNIKKSSGNKNCDNKSSLIGNVYLARINRIEKAIEAVFVKITNDLNAFLSFSNICPNYFKKNAIKKGGYIIVQITRDTSATKLANCTTYIVLTGLHCVFFPNTLGIKGISRKIKGESRIQIKEFLEQFNCEGSLVVRTASTFATPQDIQSDYDHLNLLWKEIQQKAEKRKNVALLHSYDQLLQLLRSYSKYSIKQVIVSDKDLHKKILEYVSKNLLSLPTDIQFSSKDIFSDVQEQINKLYKNELSLPSGGSVIFEYTHAFTSIDVNSKRYLKEKQMNLTAFKTNLEAASVICEQIILRNLGGIIVIDFIDMEDSEQIYTLNKNIKDFFKNDKAIVKIVEFSKLGIVHLSRQRLGASIVEKQFHACSHCFGYGYILTNNAMASSILSQIQNFETMIIYTSSEIMNMILNMLSCSTGYSSIFYGKNIKWELVDKDHKFFNQVVEIK